VYHVEKLLVLLAISKQMKNALRKPNLTLWNEVLAVDESVRLQMLNILEKSLRTSQATYPHWTHLTTQMQAYSV